MGGKVRVKREIYEIVKGLVPLDELLDDRDRVRPWDFEQYKDMSRASCTLIRRHYVEQLYIQGWNRFQIATGLVIPYSTVKNDWKWIEKEALQKVLEDEQATVRDRAAAALFNALQRAEEHRRLALTGSTTTDTRSLVRSGDVKVKDEDALKNLKPSDFGRVEKETKQTEHKPDIHEANRALELQIDIIERVMRLYRLDVKGIEVDPKGPIEIIYKWLDEDETEKDDEGAGAGGESPGTPTPEGKAGSPDDTV